MKKNSINLKTNNMRRIKTEVGYTRRVFIFDDFVIKIPRIYWLKALRTALFEIETLFTHKINGYDRHEKYEEDRIQKENYLKIKVLTIKNYEVYSTKAHFLLSGIMANLHERRFYKKTKNPFCMPTYFSFLGLLNIQKKGEWVEFWRQSELLEYITTNSGNKNQIFCDAHSLSELKNYAIDDGKLKLVDYGSRQVGEFLKENGESLSKNFKHPDY